MIYRENKKQDFQAEDLIIRSRDVQLLRVTKEMQEFLRSGDVHKQASEVSNLEKISEHNQKTHIHQLKEKESIIKAMKVKRKKKIADTRALEAQIQDLQQGVKDRYEIQETKSKSTAI